MLAARSATYVIHQDVSYTYTAPVRDLHQRLVIVPRNHHVDQRRLAQRFSVRGIEPSVTRRRTDRFGNSVLDISAPNVSSRIDFVARAVVMRNRQVSSSDAWRPDRPTSTRLTAADASLWASAHDLRIGGDIAEAADVVSDFVRRSFRYRHDVTSVRTTAAEAWQLREGVCQDMAHVMIAICSTLGIAARYVSGHLIGDGASHAWVEVLDHGRHEVIAIDPTHNRRTDLRYITTATGRDYLDVAPTTGFYTSDGGRGHLCVRKSIRVAEID